MLDSTEFTSICLNNSTCVLCVRSDVGSAANAIHFEFIDVCVRSNKARRMNVIET